MGAAAGVAAADAAARRGSDGNRGGDGRGYVSKGPGRSVRGGAARAPGGGAALGGDDVAGGADRTRPPAHLDSSPGGSCRSAGRCSRPTWCLRLNPRAGPEGWGFRARVGGGRGGRSPPAAGRGWRLDRGRSGPNRWVVAGRPPPSPLIPGGRGAPARGGSSACRGLRLTIEGGSAGRLERRRVEPWVSRGYLCSSPRTISWPSPFDPIRSRDAVRGRGWRQAPSPRAINTGGRELCLQPVPIDVPVSPRYIAIMTEQNTGADRGGLKPLRG